MVMDVRDMSAFDTRSFAAVMDKGSLFCPNVFLINGSAVLLMLFG